MLCYILGDAFGNNGPAHRLAYSTEVRHTSTTLSPSNLANKLCFGNAHHVGMNGRKERRVCTAGVTETELSTGCCLCCWGSKRANRNMPTWEPITRSCSHFDYCIPWQWMATGLLHACAKWVVVRRGRRERERDTCIHATRTYYVRANLVSATSWELSQLLHQKVSIPISSLDRTPHNGTSCSTT